MINRAAIYLVSTGEILRWVSCSSYDLLIQCMSGENYLVDCPAWATHVIDGEPVRIEPEPHVPTDEEIIARLKVAVQHNLDSVASQREYDGILSLCSYATSTDAQFSAEGQAGVEWRDACWRKCYEVMADVKAGLRPIPTSEELVAELPEFTWPA